MKVDSIEIDGRKVFSVRAFNQGIASWLQRLPTVWVEGEVTELRRQERWASVFLTLKDPEHGSCVAVQMARGQFDALRLGLGDGERVHVYGRPELYEQRGDFHLRALTIERYGLGAHLAALERLSRRCSRMRMHGSTGIDMAYTAAGALGGAISFGHHIWDHAAGVALVRAAGGVVTDFLGDPWTPTSRSALAGVPGVHAELLEIIQAVGSPEDYR